MIAIDTNILVYSHRADSSWHERALAAITRLAEGATPWALPWQCVHEFLSIVTHPRIFQPPTPMAEALAVVASWTGSPACVLLAEGPEHETALGDVLTAGRIVGPRVHDGRIAAICRQHGIRELWSADRDFSRFPDLTVVNPLVAE